jgi:predicted DNA-binding transcriptional regulator AlpA
MPAPPDPWLTTAEVAQRLRQPESTVRYWRHKGIGPRGIRIGRRIVYRTSEIDRFERAAESEQAERAS